MKHILIVDDDVYIGNLLEEALTQEGYLVLRAYSGTEALLFLAKSKPDLVLLDLMLPGLSGEGLLPKIKDIPVIVVSAKADIDGKAALLLGGAADYVTKPFAMKELLARIAVGLRSAQPANNAVLRFMDIELDPLSHTVFVHENKVKLTRTEYAILKILMHNPARVVTKSHLLERVSSDTPDCTDSSLKMHISNLRKKLRGGGGKDYIEAVWGIGFKLKSDAKHQ